MALIAPHTFVSGDHANSRRELCLIHPNTLVRGLLQPEVGHELGIVDDIADGVGVPIEQHDLLLLGYQILDVFGLVQVVRGSEVVLVGNVIASIGCSLLPGGLSPATLVRRHTIGDHQRHSEVLSLEIHRRVIVVGTGGKSLQIPYTGRTQLTSNFCGLLKYFRLNCCRRMVE